MDLRGKSPVLWGTSCMCLLMRLSSRMEVSAALEALHTVELGMSSGGSVAGSNHRELLAWDGEPKEAIIFELECMAVMFAYNLFEKVLANRSVVVFTDNQGVLGALVKGWSTSALGHAITLRVCILEEGLHIYFWYDRVPSASNPSDPLSRDDFSAMDARLRCEISNADVLEWIKVLES